MPIKIFTYPIILKVNVSHLIKEHQSEKKFPYTALLVKAAALLLRDRPSINKMYFKTLFGERILEPDYIAVNMPISLRIDGKYVLSAHAAYEPQNLSLFEIMEDIKQIFKKGWKDLPINNIIHNGSNNFINRFKLKMIHFFVYKFPKLYSQKKAGGISVSSLMNLNQNLGGLQMMALGATPITISSCASYIENGKTYLNIGIGINHSVVHGEIATEAVTHLAKIFESEEYTHQLIS